MKEYRYVSALMSRVSQDNNISLHTLSSFVFNGYLNQLIMLGLIKNIAEEGKGRLLIYPLAREEELVNAFVQRSAYFERPEVISRLSSHGYSPQQVMVKFGLSRYGLFALLGSGIIVNDKGTVPEESVSRLERILKGKAILNLTGINKEYGTSKPLIHRRVKHFVDDGFVQMIGKEGKGTVLYICDAAEKQAVIYALRTGHFGKDYWPDELYPPNHFPVGGTVNHHSGQKGKENVTGWGQVTVVEVGPFQQGFGHDDELVRVRLDSGQVRALVVKIDGKEQPHQHYTPTTLP